MSSSLRIGVVGPRNASTQELQFAFDAGRAIGARQAILVCGGLGGVMEASARGCAQSGGTVIGILPGTDASAANAFVSIPVVTGLNEARNAVVVNTSEAIVAIGGSFGTLSEIALALGVGIPVVALESWRFSAPSYELDLVIRASSADEAVQKALDCALARRRGAGA